MRRRGARGLAVLAGGVLVAGIGITGYWGIQGGSGTGPGAGGRPTAVRAATSGRWISPRSGASPVVPRVPAGGTLLAIVRSAAPRYARPGLPFQEAGTVLASWEYRPSVLPVIERRPGWVRVRLPQRPNGSTAWLPDRDVTFATTPYRIVISLATMHLALYDRGRRVLDAPAGIGTRGDPTPTGRYFLAFDEPPPLPNPGYGPFIMVTSAHSPSISDWQGSGDALIGIHGPLGADRAIGRHGARISHGCIRLHLAALDKLRNVPPGTPIDITG